MSAFVPSPSPPAPTLIFSPSLSISVFLTLCLQKGLAALSKGGVKVRIGVVWGPELGGVLEEDPDRGKGTRAEESWTASVSGDMLFPLLAFWLPLSSGECSWLGLGLSLHSPWVDGWMGRWRDSEHRSLDWLAGRSWGLTRTRSHHQPL